MKNHKDTLGLLFGNRDFFPDSLVEEARKDYQKLAQELNLSTIQLDAATTKLGGVETHAEAKACARLFKANADEIGGIIVVLPNFGDEKGVLETLKLANLNVPVLIHAYPDSLDRLDVVRRRDAFCGKISVCNNLRQAGIPYSLTTRHVVHPSDPSFREDLERFRSVCRVVNGLRNLRIGAVGARPSAFNTVRYSEKILERNGISVTTVDLSEILGAADKLEASDKELLSKIEEIKGYANTTGVPADKLEKMARLGVILDTFIADNDLDATAIQCWTSVQVNHGCNFCTSMSMMSEELAPSACEVDVTGVLTMYAMQLASSSPSALVDWNNNYGDEDNKCVLFHCGNWAKSFLDEAKVSTAPILGTSVGEDNTYGALDGRTPAAPLTFGRLSTDDTTGKIKGYFGEGRLTNDDLKTFGNRAVAEVQDLQELMQFVCREGFEHHVVMNASHTAEVMMEACEVYLGWDVHRHPAKED